MGYQKQLNNKTNSWLMASEQIIVKIITFLLAPVAIFAIGIALLLEGRVFESVSWIFGDWKEPL
ncbi:hypothetical protein [Haladaptatus salinisoli]|uniref:hypothetical protein n=1 Tax=Haladaptatus salinisoli TaxID=2884876 RepID=UPI001D0A608F|nr:hypothetical protein [Haladaptatus salinisoli]